MSTRTSYEARFGAEQADALVAAATEHENGLHDKRGSDPFRWAVAIALGYQCVEKYADSHGITVPWEDFHEWVKSDGDLAAHDGDVDYVALFAGTYNEYVGQPS